MKRLPLFLSTILSASACGLACQITAASAEDQITVKTTDPLQVDTAIKVIPWSQPSALKKAPDTSESHMDELDRLSKKYGGIKIYKKDSVPQPADLKRDLDESITKGDGLYNQSKYEDAIKVYKEGLKECGDVIPADPERIDLVASKINCLLSLARAQDKADKNLASGSRSLALFIAKNALHQDEANLVLLLATAECEGSRGFADLISGDEESALMHSEQSVDYFEKCISKSPSGKAYCGKAYSLLTASHCGLILPERMECLEDEFYSFRQAMKAGFASPKILSDCASALTELSSCYLYMKSKKSSQRVAVQAISLFDEAVKADPSCKPAIDPDYLIATKLAAGTFKSEALDQEVKEWKRSQD